MEVVTKTRKLGDLNFLSEVERVNRVMFKQDNTDVDRVKNRGLKDFEGQKNYGK